MDKPESTLTPQEWNQFLKVGSRFIMAGREYELITPERAHITFAADAGGHRMQLTRSIAIEHLHLGRMELLFCGLDEELTNGMAVLNQDRLNSGVRALRYTSALVREFGWKWCTSSETFATVINDVAKDFGEKAVAVSTLYLWRERALRFGLTIWGMAPRTHCRGKRVLTDEEQHFRTFEVQAYDEGLELYFLTTGLRSLKKSRDMIRTWLATNNDAQKRALLGTFKSMTWFERHMRTYDQHYVTLKRFGKDHADKAFRAAGRGKEPSRLLQIALADGLVLKVLLRSRRDGRIVGRGYATIMLELSTSETLACNVSSIPFCTSTVLAALEMAVTDSPGTSRGTPGILDLDNGKSDYATDALKAAAKELGIVLRFGERAQANHKAELERLNRDINDFIRTWPGATHPDQDAREYDAEAHAVIFDDQAPQLVADFLAIRSVDASGTRRAPRAAFEEAAAAHPPLTYTAEQADMLCRAQKIVVVTSGRVRFQGLFWFSHSLRDYEERMRSKGKRPVATLFYKDSDLSHVFVRYKDNGAERMIRANGTKPLYMASLTLVEHLWVAKLGKEKRLRDLAIVPEEELCRRRFELWQRLTSMAENNRKELKTFGYIIHRNGTVSSPASLPELSPSAKKLIATKPAPALPAPAASATPDEHAHAPKDDQASGTAALPALPPPAPVVKTRRLATALAPFRP